MTNPEAVDMAPDKLLRRLKLRQLVVLDSVLSHGSLLRAAEALNLTQPSVTKTVQALEDSFGVALLERTNRGIQATVYGELLRGRVKAILAEVRYLSDEMTALQGGMRGHVVIGTSISAAAWLLPRAITRLKAHAPRVLVTITEGTNDQLIPGVATAELDMVVGRIPARVYPRVRHEALFTESLSAVVRTGHPLLGETDVSIASAAAYPWIVPIRESPVRETVESLFRDEGLQLPEQRVESLSILTNVNLIAASDTIGMLPRAAADPYIERGTLARLRFHRVVPFGSVGVSLADGRDPSPAAAAFIEALRAVARQHVGSNIG